MNGLARSTASVQVGSYDRGQYVESAAEGERKVNYQAGIESHRCYNTLIDISMLETKRGLRCFRK